MKSMSESRHPKRAIWHWSTATGIAVGVAGGMALLNWMPASEKPQTVAPDTSLTTVVAPRGNPNRVDTKERNRRWLMGYTRSNLDGISRLTVEEMLAQLNDSRIPYQNLDYEDDTILLRLIEEDPVEALKWCLETKHYRRHLDLVFEQVARIDLSIAMDALEKLEQDQVRTQAIRGIALGMAADDPGRALRYLETAEKPHHYKSSFTAIEIIASWRRKDPEAAGVFILDTRRSRDRGKMINQLAASWATKDLQEAIDWMQKSIPVPLDRRKFANALLRDLTEKGDLGQAFGTLAKVVSPTELNEFAREFAGQLARKDSHAAVNWANSIEHSLVRQRALGEGAYATVQSDPDQALEITRTLNNPDMRAKIYAWHVRNLARENPKLAVITAQALNKSDGRVYATRNVINEWYSQDKAAATEYILSANDERRSTMARRLATRLSSSELEKWVAHFPSEERRSLVEHAIKQRNYSANIARQLRETVGQP